MVCAPTSSGKTFISSYVIQQVLKPEASAAAAAAAAQAALAGPHSAAAAGSSKQLSANRASKGHKTYAADRKGTSDIAAASIATASTAAAGSGPTSDGVVVIVLPTKALVNQLAAQVRKRYMRVCTCLLEQLKSWPRHYRRAQP